MADVGRSPNAECTGEGDKREREIIGGLFDSYKVDDSDGVGPVVDEEAMVPPSCDTVLLICPGQNGIQGKADRQALDVLHYPFFLHYYHQSKPGSFPSG